MKNKVVKKFAIMLSFVILITTIMAVSFSAFGSDELQLTLYSPQTVTVDRGGVQWFSYTPQYSANYTFASRTPSVPPVVVDTYGIIYDSDKQTVISENDDIDLAGGNYNFSTSAYLEKGKTYYFTAKHAVSTVKGQVCVVLTSDKSSSIDYFTADVGSFTYEENRNGTNSVDENGNSYYEYNYSYVIEHLTLNVYYSDGTNAVWTYGSGNGETILNGIDIYFESLQSKNHWAPGADNEFSIIYMGEKVTLNIEIVGKKGTVKFRIVNENFNNAVAGANVYQGSKLVATSDDYGYVEYTNYLNTYDLTVKYDDLYAVKRVVTVVISSADSTKELPSVPLLFGDMNLDGKFSTDDINHFSSFLGKTKNTKEFDANSDGIINVRDIILLSKNGLYNAVAFAKAIGKVESTDCMDLNGDGVINSRDMRIISKNFNFSSYDELVLK